MPNGIFYFLCKEAAESDIWHLNRVNVSYIYSEVASALGQLAELTEIRNGINLSLAHEHRTSWRNGTSFRQPIRRLI